MSPLKTLKIFIPVLLLVAGGVAFSAALAFGLGAAWSVPLQAGAARLPALHGRASAHLHALPKAAAGHAAAPSTGRDEPGGTARG
jgi:hypothetical protein